MRAIVMVSAAALALAVGVATASGGGGNSANAKQCQKGGWQTLAGSDGSPFANQDACVSYGAKGGSIIPAHFARSASNCTLIGGAFALGTTPVLWSCSGFPTPDESAAEVALIVMLLSCQADDPNAVMNGFADVPRQGFAACLVIP